MVLRTECFMGFAMLNQEMQGELVIVRLTLTQPGLLIYLNQYPCCEPRLTLPK